MRSEAKYDTIERVGDGMNDIFLRRMQEYLQEEYPAYLQTLEDAPYRGIRVNTAKISVADFLKLNICDCKPSSICPQSFYIPQEQKSLGNHPAHLAGLFYMQEPSASSAVEVLDVQKGDWVLDLCAAPGGKSTQIAAKLADSGFLVSNEIDAKRANVLLSNMERLGFSSTMITNAHPQQIAKEMSGWFDRVLVDAPCSGEGMFKRHSKAMEDWSEEHVRACAKRQLHILDSAYATLKEGGTLVYSTCTYSIEENEAVVDAFLQTYPDMELVDCDVDFGRSGLPYRDLDMQKMRRIFPMDQGEGHFVAKLYKHGFQKQSPIKQQKQCEVHALATQFLQRSLTSMPPYVMEVHHRIYAMLQPFVKLKDIRVLRQGCLVGEIVKNRLEPHQHLYVSNAFGTTISQYYDMNEEECRLFLQGQQLFVSGYKGYTQMRIDGHAIGFAKGDGQVLKNKYPKGLRINGTS